MSGLCSLARPKKNDANKKEATGLHRILLFPFTDRFTGFHHVLSGFKMGYWVYRGFMVFLEKKSGSSFFYRFSRRRLPTRGEFYRFQFYSKFTRFHRDLMVFGRVAGFLL